MDQLICETIRATSWLSARHGSRVASQRSRCLHATTFRGATPLPHPTFPGPPPSAPQAAVSLPQDRVARKRSQAEALRLSQQAKVNPAKPQSALRKRFWKNASVKESEEGLQIHLDTRPVRTATRQALSLPKSKRALAVAIALEWDQLVSAQQALKQHFVPLTSLTSRALDIEMADKQSGSANDVRESIVKTALRYLSTDTLLCWAPEHNMHDPYSQQGVKSLRTRQREVAEPIIAFLTTHIFPGVEIVPILGPDSIRPAQQPEMTREVIRGWVAGLPAFELAALERGVLATKSLLVAARLLVEWSNEYSHLRKQPDTDAIEKPVFDVEAASEAANLEVLHQTEQWGEVEDTHDVEREDIRRQLGSVILLVS